MSQVEITVRKDSSLQIKGEVILKDQDGNIIPQPSQPFTLCRCGRSKTQPFCDRTHKAMNWKEGT
jgi:CDGSH-type Zn-finger protein